MEIEELKSNVLSLCLSDEFSLELLQEKIKEYKKVNYDALFFKVANISCACCGISFEQLMSRSRVLGVVRAKRLVMRFYREKRYSLQSCGDFFGQDHSNVYHGLTTLNRDYKENHGPTVDAIKKFDALIETERIK